MTTGLPVFDASVQETNVWLKLLMDRLHTDDRHAAYLALRAALHALRDRLGPENAAHLGAQLPLLLRGVYYEGWHMAGTPTRERRVAGFIEHVRDELPRDSVIDPNMAARAALAVLWEKLDPGEVAKIQRILPQGLQDLWPPEARHAGPGA
jgi:uncharacterized protein (DUF2267 family)